MTSRDRTSYAAAGSAAGSRAVISGRTSWCPRTPTFVVEDALHLHAAPGVGDAQGTAGDQALGRGRPVGGPHQAPVGLVVGPLQDFHRLAAADGELGAIAGREVMDHHGQLAAAGQLGRTGHRSASAPPPRACSR